ncbi:MAG: indole-3-glycerol phosphate synthase TrpC [Calditrichia bacterium]
MSTILNKILKHKRDEIEHNKKIYPTAYLKTLPYYDSNCISLKKYIKRKDKYGIIAEFKRKSPSRGWINPHLKARDISLGYMQAGASAVSVLTDKHYFAGENFDLMEARKVNFSPILRKDFIIDEYQVHESKAIGADAILLIASALEKSQISDLTELAHELGMEVLFEIHNPKEFEEKYTNTIDMVGINARDLHTFHVSVQEAIRVKSFIPEGLPTIAESGIQSPEDYSAVKKAGFDGVLIGGYFMQQPSPVKACYNFVKQIQGYSPVTEENVQILGI